MAECELNLPEKSYVGSATLTSSDLNELGCTSSTSGPPQNRATPKSGHSPTGPCAGQVSLSQPESIRSRRTTSVPTHLHPSQSVRSSSLLSIFRKTRSTNKPPNVNLRSRSTHGAIEHEKRAQHANARQRTSRSSSRVFVDILKTLTGGFANCSRKENHEDGDHVTRRGSNSCGSHSDDSSNNLDLCGQYQNSGTRRKSHDGSHDGTNGSDSTSTGYVSDSSNEKHYPKNKKSSQNSSRADTVRTISKRVDSKEEVDLETAWSDAIKAAATIRRPLVSAGDPDEDDPPDTGQIKEKHILDDPSGSPHLSLNVALNPESLNAEIETPESVKFDLGEVNEGKICRYIASSASDEELTGSDDSLYTTGSESASSDYETNETSSYEDDTDEKEIKGARKQLDIIKEEDEEVPTEQEKTVPTEKKKAVKRRKSTLKRKRTLKGEADRKSVQKSVQQKDEDAISRTGSLKDMILQFETAVAALEIGDARENADFTKDKDGKSPLQGVKAIAQKIQEQAQIECAQVEQMPPSQILKLKQALELEPKEDLSHPIPLSRRSESKVAQIARQLAEAERQRAAAEKLAAAKGGKSPKTLRASKSSTSFINELLEMARAESVEKVNDQSVAEAAPDFKQSLLAARKKITQREAEEKRKNEAKLAIEKHTGQTGSKIKPETLQPTLSASSIGSDGSGEGSGGPSPNEEIDPFVKEVLRSKTVPEPVKQKIRIECWSLFNDPRTPKGVKQCILATMLSKVQNE